MPSGMATVMDAGSDDGGFRLDRWREGVTSARIRWRDGQGVEHERVLGDEGTALSALDWVGGHPRMQLVAFEMS
jgi:hypothetical protein